MKSKFFYVTLLSLLFYACSENNQPSYEGGSLPGEFSVGTSQKVHFSQGNLQYVGTWRFAKNQWDCFGTSQSDNHRDLFGWGTGDAPNNVSGSANDYATFTDWGVNPITNGGNEANAWRTLTYDEWVYLLYGRTNASTLFGLGSVHGVNGMILLPDNWTLPEGISFIGSTTQGLINLMTDCYNNDGNHFSPNIYTAAQWKVMETAGAVFLPTAGYRSDRILADLVGFYWSATPDGTTTADAFYFKFDSHYFYLPEVLHRASGISVRLVQEVRSGV